MGTRDESTENTSSCKLITQLGVNSEVPIRVPMDSLKINIANPYTPTKTNTTHIALPVPTLILNTRNQLKGSSISFKAKTKSTLSRTSKRPRMTREKNVDPRRLYVERLVSQRIHVFNAHYVKTMKNYLSKLCSSLNCDISGCEAAQRRLYRHYQQCHPESIPNLQPPPICQVPCDRLKDRLQSHNIIHHPNEVANLKGADIASSNFCKACGSVLDNSSGRGSTIECNRENFADKGSSTGRGSNVGRDSASGRGSSVGRDGTAGRGSTAGRSSNAGRVSTAGRNFAPPALDTNAQELQPKNNQGVYEKAIKYWLTKVPFNPNDNYETITKRERAIQTLINTVEQLSTNIDDLFYEDKVKEAVENFLNTAGVMFPGDIGRKEFQEGLRDNLWNKFLLINYPELKTSRPSVFSGASRMSRLSRVSQQSRRESCDPSLKPNETFYDPNSYIIPIKRERLSSKRESVSSRRESIRSKKESTPEKIREENEIDKRLSTVSSTYELDGTNTLDVIDNEKPPEINQFNDLSLRRKSILRNVYGNVNSDVDKYKNFQRRQSIRIKSAPEVNRDSSKRESMIRQVLEKANLNKGVEELEAGISNVPDRRESRRESVKLALIKSPILSFTNHRNNEEENDAYASYNKYSKIRNSRPFERKQNTITNDPYRNRGRTKRFDSSLIRTRDGREKYLSAKNRIIRQSSTELIIDSDEEPINIQHIPRQSYRLSKIDNNKMINRKKQNFIGFSRFNQNENFGTCEDDGLKDDLSPRKLITDSIYSPYNEYQSNINITPGSKNTVIYDEYYGIPSPISKNGKYRFCDRNDKKQIFASDNGNTKIYDKHRNRMNIISNHENNDKYLRHNQKFRFLSKNNLIRKINELSTADLGKEEVVNITRSKPSLISQFHQNATNALFIRNSTSVKPDSFNPYKGRVSIKPISDTNFFGSSAVVSTFTNEGEYLGYENIGSNKVNTDKDTSSFSDDEGIDFLQFLQRAEEDHVVDYSGKHTTDNIFYEQSNFSNRKLAPIPSIKTIKPYTNAPSTISTWGRIKSNVFEDDIDSSTMMRRNTIRKFDNVNEPTTSSFVYSDKNICICGNKDDIKKRSCYGVTKAHIRRVILSWMENSNFNREVESWNKPEVIEELIKHLKLPCKDVSKQKLKSEIIRLLKELDISAKDYSENKAKMDAFAGDLANRLIDIQQKLMSSRTHNWKCNLRRHKLFENMEFIMVGPNEVMRSDLKHDLMMDVRDCLLDSKIGNNREIREHITEVLLENLELIRINCTERVADEIFDILEELEILDEYEIIDLTDSVIFCAKEIITFICTTNNRNDNILNNNLKSRISVFMTENHTNPIFFGASTTNKNKSGNTKLSADEKTYTSGIVTVVKNWLLNAPDNFKHVRDDYLIQVMASELADEVKDYVKLNQLAPETDTDNVVTYHAYKWMLKFKLVNNVQDAEPYVRKLVGSITKMRIPELIIYQVGASHNINMLEYKKNKHGTKEIKDLMEEEITKWINEQPPDIFQDDNSGIINYVNELAEKLKPKLIAHESDESLSKDIRHWMKKVINDRKITRIESLSFNLMIRIKCIPMDIESNKPHPTDEIETPVNILQNKNLVVENLSDSIRHIILTYIEHLCVTDDSLIKRGYTMVLKSELQKFGPKLRKVILENCSLREPLEKFSPESLNDELMYVRDISDWLRELPVDPFYNSTGNKDRLEFIINLSKDIAKVEKERRDLPFSMDYNSRLTSIIIEYMKLLPLKIIQDKGYTTLVNQLVAKVAIRRTEERRPLPEFTNDLPQFVEEFIRINGEENADDPLRFEAWTSRFTKETTKLMAETEDLNCCEDTSCFVPPTDESVEMFNLKLEYVNDIIIWIKKLPICGTVPIEMPYNLAFEMAKFTSGAISFEELIKYTQSWVSRLPLHCSQDIDKAVMIDELLNRMANVNENLKRKNENVHDVCGPSQQCQNITEVIPQNHQAGLSCICKNTNAIKGVLSSNNDGRRRSSADRRISFHDETEQNEDATRKSSTRQSYSLDNEKLCMCKRLSKDESGRRRSTDLHISSDHDITASDENPYDDNDECNRPSTSRCGSRRRESNLESMVLPPNSGDVIIRIVEQWCNYVPLGSLPCGQQCVIRKNLTNKILNKINELNSDHNTFRQNELYTHLLDLELEKLINTLPQSDILAQYKDVLKNDLIKSINSVKALIIEEWNRQFYRRGLENIVKKYTKCPSNLTGGKEILIKDVREDIVDNFIEYLLEPRIRRQAYKNNMAEDLVTYHMEIMMVDNEFETRKKVPIELNKMMHEMSIIPPPREKRLRDELEYIRTKQYVKEFLCIIPVKGGRESLEIILTKELHSMGRMGYDDYNIGNMKAMIERYLQQYGVLTFDKRIYDDARTYELIDKLRQLAAENGRHYNLQQTSISEYQDKYRLYDFQHNEAKNLNVKPMSPTSRRKCWPVCSKSQKVNDRDYIGTTETVKCQKCLKKKLPQTVNKDRRPPAWAFEQIPNHVRSTWNDVKYVPCPHLNPDNKANGLQNTRASLGQSSTNIQEAQCLQNCRYNDNVTNPYNQFANPYNQFASPQKTMNAPEDTFAGGQNPYDMFAPPQITTDVPIITAVPKMIQREISITTHKPLNHSNDTIHQGLSRTEPGPSHDTEDLTVDRDCYCELYPVHQVKKTKRISSDNFEDLSSNHENKD